MVLGNRTIWYYTRVTWRPYLEFLYETPHRNRVKFYMPSTCLFTIKKKKKKPRQPFAKSRRFLIKKQKDLKDFVVDLPGVARTNIYRIHQWYYMISYHVFCTWICVVISVTFNPVYSIPYLTCYTDIISQSWTIFKK